MRKVVKVQPPRNEVILAKCLDPVRGISRFEDNSIDHVITDPPYEKECHTEDKMWRPGKGGEKIDRVQLDFDAMDEFQRKTVAKHIVRVTRGWALVFCQDEGVPLWREALLSAGAKWRRTCIWYKTQCTPKMTGDGPAQGHEPFVAVWCGSGASVWNGGGRSNVFPHATGKNVHHDTEKPMPLARDLVVTFTMPGELILDPYAGGGSFLVAAKEAGRDVLGYEINPKHHKTIVDRLASTKTRSGFEQMLMGSRKLKPSAGGFETRKVKRGDLDL